MNAVFVYGTLMPGQPRWASIKAFVQGAPRAGQIRGRLLDTGLGFPALVGGEPHRWVSGVVLELLPSRITVALNRLDQIEGTDAGLYARVRVTTRDGDAAWTYRWVRSTLGMGDLCGAWPGQIGT